MERSGSWVLRPLFEKSTPLSRSTKCYILHYAFGQVTDTFLSNAFLGCLKRFFARPTSFAYFSFPYLLCWRMYFSWSDPLGYTLEINCLNMVCGYHILLIIGSNVSRGLMKWTQFANGDWHISEWKITSQCTFQKSCNSGPRLQGFQQFTIGSYGSSSSFRCCKAYIFIVAVKIRPLQLKPSLAVAS